jgi:hypothetical protein
MRAVGSIPEVLDLIQQVKAQSSAYCTNFFPVTGKLQPWIEHQELFMETHEGAAFFLRNDRGFKHLFFCAPDLSSLQRGLDVLPSHKTERIVLDLVGDGPILENLLSLLELAGFRRYKQLCRMTRIAQAQPAREFGQSEPRTEFASREDCAAIARLLDASFDVYAEQLPAAYEIERAVDEHQILVVKQQQDLAGLLFFETQGFTSAVRFWLVAEQFRSARCGAALMRQYIALHDDVRRFVLWVMKDNPNAIQKYQHYGYQPDKLVDHVLINALIHP